MVEKKSDVSKRRGAGKILLTTTLAGTAATSAMAQSTTTSAGFMDLLKSAKIKVSSALKKVKDKLPTTNTLIKTVISAAGAISLKGYIEEIVTSSKKKSMNSVIGSALFNYSLHGDAERAMAPVVNSGLLRIPGFSKFLTFFLVSIVGYSIYQFAPVLLEKVKKGGKYLWNMKENLEIKKLCNEIEEELNQNINVYTHSNQKFVLFSKLDGKTRIRISTGYYIVSNEAIKNSKNIRFKVEESPGRFCVKIVNENDLTLTKGPLNEDILLESPKYREYMEKHDSSGPIKKKIENYYKNIEECKNLYKELNNKLKISVVREDNGEHWIYIKDKQNDYEVISKFEYRDDWSGSEELEFGTAVTNEEVHIDIRPRNNVKDILKLNGVEEKLKEYIENKDNTLQ